MDPTATPVTNDTDADENVFNRVVDDLLTLFSALKHLPMSPVQEWRSAEWTTPGTYAAAWTCPDGVYTVYVTMCGGGGGGAGGSASRFGGGGAAFYVNMPIPVTPGVAYDVTVGASGLGTVSPASSGGHGGLSSFLSSGYPGLWAMGGIGGQNGTTTNPDKYGVMGSGLGRNFNWTEFGAIGRGAYSGLDSNPISSIMAKGGSLSTLSTNKPAGKGGGGGSGWTGTATDAFPGHASLGRGGDPPTTNSTTGLNGGPGYVSISWQE